jgi:transcriptional regulator with XRE-family HTH domain
MMRSRVERRVIDCISIILEHVSSMKEEVKPQGDTQINARIAARVRKLRSALGLSLEALSKKCGVSRSMISLVERGESSPTAIVLQKIASGIGVPLAELFDDSAEPASPLSRPEGRTTWRDPESGYIRRNISPANFPSPIHIVEVMLPAGARVAYESAPGQGDMYQQVWVQQGQVEVSVGETIHRLAADDCVAMRLGVPTAFANRTRRPASYIVVIAHSFGRS